MAAPKILVPFPRVRKENQRGRDIQQDRRALTRAGFWPVNTSTTPHTFYDKAIFTHKLVMHVRAFQRAKKLKVTGEIDRATHNALATPYRDKAGKVHAYGHYGKAGAVVMADVQKKLVAQEKYLLNTGSVVSRTVASALLCVRHRALIGYTQGGLRMIGVTRKMFPPNFPHWMDCSSGYTWWKYAGGAPDPNRLGYNGLGYTGTQSIWGVVYAWARAPLTAAVFYSSRGRIGHIAMVVVKGSKVVSHGSSAGPVLTSITYRPPTIVRLHPNNQRPGFKPWPLARAA